jgi:TRAP transporter TAXI family solute receptor
LPTSLVERCRPIDVEVPMKMMPLVCAAFLTVTTAIAQEGAKPMSTTTPLSLSLGTATPGGGFPLYGDAFAEVMNKADPSLTLVTRNTKGSTENIPLLEAGQLDVALVAGEPAYEAFKGIGRAPTKLKIITALYSNPGMFVVRADSPYKTIRDLVGKPIAFGAKGSGLVFLSRYVLDGIGLDQDKDFQAVYLDRAGDGPAMVQDSRAKRCRMRSPIVSRKRCTAQKPRSARGWLRRRRRQHRIRWRPRLMWR